ncbi:U11/U12 small nuclear ribonucleoprotein 25 kDa protein isoform X1 [Hydra vulgaris]|uniref:U11/U12 small nuclear ribonucleoprotein 25 kDa protein isoform X1 n=1 Tax=Hydra vulgaris TaxID=6087 RepID=UPI001F5F9D2D|nr:U11/U12 small nuclear ribonucleoprotein 25 kDa protein [Hydra vulgaris]
MSETNEEYPAVLSLSHKEAFEATNELLQKLLNDALLKDLPNDVTSKDLKAKIALEKGRAFIVYLKRATETGLEDIPLIVDHKTKLIDLKLNIQRTLSRKIKEEKGTSCLSWKYFWKTYWLVHNNEKLTDGSKTMKAYGIKENAEIMFVKRLRKT